MTRYHYACRNKHFYQNHPIKVTRDGKQFSKNYETKPKDKFLATYRSNDKNEIKQSFPQPMEVESTKSKLTLNRKQLHNNEVHHTDSPSESEEEEDGNVDLNFCWVQKTHRIT